jgi:hypothetical protein
MESSNPSPKSSPAEVSNPVRSNPTAWRPRGIGAPGERRTDVPRSPTVPPKSPNDRNNVIAIGPNKELTLTTVENPTLLFYIPKTSAESIEFWITVNRTRYKLPVSPPQSDGIYPFQLSSVPGLPALKREQEFRWDLVVADSSGRWNVYGTSKRVSLDAQVQQQLDAATTPGARSAIYAWNSIWHEALMTLFEARKRAPQDTELTQQWNDLLTAVDLRDLIGK